MTRHPLRSLVPAALATALLVAACGTANPSPSAGSSPTPSPTAAATQGGTATPAPSASAAAAACDPSAPAASGEPIPLAEDSNAALYEAIEAQVSELRGITATMPVERGVFTKASLCAYLTESFHKHNPEAYVTSTEKIYKALGLMPAEESLATLLLELQSSQVVGLYDDDTKKMYVVVSENGEIGPAEQMTYAHEYTHALQDQRFKIGEFLREVPKDQGDRALARRTLVEGDAYLLMALWAQQHLTPQQLGELGSAVDPASEAIVDRMPAILKDTLLFPYTAGLQVSLAAFQQGGGYAGVDRLYANPPDTTEQVLHPDKLQADEQAVKVAFPAGFPASLGSGWKVALEDTLGEFQLEILLRDAAKAEAPGDAAKGWGGDRVALIEGPDGAEAVVIDTAWDTDADAAEFAAGLDGYAARLEAAGRAAGVFTPSPDRVVVISATDPDTLGKVANALGLAG